MRTPEDALTLARLRDQCPLIGFTSYMDFPAGREPGDELDYGGMCVAWCHCFREPERYLPHGTRWLRLTHADFLDWSRVDPNPLPPRGGRDVDFVYVCEKGAWKEQVKNWRLARRCLPVLTEELGLRGLLVGRPAVEDLGAAASRLTVRDRVSWAELMHAFATARFLFVPNELDACPRILAEALAANTAVIVNRRILGGWHYVNPFTGAFFDDERNVADAVARCFDQPLSPRRWFTSNYGYLHASRRLAAFMTEVDRSLPACRTLHLVPLT
jgi:glycosyltransferase involved in cell wall biosynthesis